jgi:HPt (histidine-containing phosphotransfer) domain-containing protein
MSKQGASRGPLEVAAAIRRLLDSRSLYLSLLGEFQRHHGGDAERLSALLAAGERRGGVSVVHSLRGAAKFIGASDLELAAQHLERCLRDDGCTDLPSLLADLGAALAAVLAEAELELRKPQ